MKLLFKHLIGTQVKHGSPGYENLETIESIITRSAQPYATIQFVSGCFTHILKTDLHKFVKKGSVQYNRAFGFTAYESIIPA
jgi:hypothetical protein